jgi:rhamnosyltransferase subunit B
VINTQPGNFTTKRFILAPLGSWGDVYPFVWLGRGLASRGHDVCAVVYPPFDAAMRAAGIRPAVYGTRGEYEAILQDPNLWHPRRGFPLIARMSEALARETIPRIREEIVPGRTLLLGAGIAFGPRIAAEAFEIPLVTVQLQPAVFLSVESPPVSRAGSEWIGRAPRWLRRALYRVAHWRMDWLLAGGLNAVRRELGLARPVRGIMRDYWMSPLRVLALFPEWFAPKQPDWPPQTVVTRFPLYDEGDHGSLPEDLEAFLVTGEAPVLFTPGSANVQAERFFEASLEACRRLGCRGLFVTPHVEQLPRGLPSSIKHVASVPFSRAFPRCKAIVHHGGIGTISQGLAAGIPQLVMAMSHDQPDNGARLRRMGVGDYLYPRAFRPSTVAARLENLVASSGVARACRRYRDLTAEQMSTADVVRLIEACHPGGPAGCAPDSGAGTGSR